MIWFMLLCYHSDEWQRFVEEQGKEINQEQDNQKLTLAWTRVVATEIEGNTHILGFLKVNIKDLKDRQDVEVTYRE